MKLDDPITMAADLNALCATESPKMPLEKKAKLLAILTETQAMLAKQIAQEVGLRAEMRRAGTHGE